MAQLNIQENPVVSFAPGNAKTKFPERLEDLPDGLYHLPVQLAEQIFTARLSDDELGYQRDIKPHKVKEVAIQLKSGMVINGRSAFATILVYRVGDRFECIDGQHRLEGHISAGVAVPCSLHTATLEQACAHFITHNKSATPVPNAHLILISDHPLALQLREIAENSKISVKQATAIVKGIFKVVTLRLDATRRPLTDSELRRIKATLDIWTNDYRFINAFADELEGAERRQYFDHEGGAFSSPTALWVLGRLIGNVDTTTIKALEREVRVFRDAQWSSKARGSLRLLCRRQGAGVCKEAYEFVKDLIVADARRRASAE